MSAIHDHEKTSLRLRGKRDFGKRRIDWVPLVLLSPLLISLLVFFIIPLTRSVLISFYKFTGPTAYDDNSLTFVNYIRFLFDPFYLGILWRTIKVSLLTTIFCLLIGYPVAYYMTKLDDFKQRLYMLIYLAPWMVNIVVKAFGWRLLLAKTGYINQILLSLGLINQPLTLMFNEFGIIVALIHGEIVFAIMPIFASLISIDPNLSWAAANLGAKPWQVFTKITFPLSLPGVVAGSVIVFTMSMAAYTTPALLGGARARVMSYLAYEQNIQLLDWPFGSAIAVILVITTLIMLQVYQKMMASGQWKVILK